MKIVLTLLSAFFMMMVLLTPQPESATATAFAEYTPLPPDTGEIQTPVAEAAPTVETSEPTAQPSAPQTAPSVEPGVPTRLLIPSIKLSSPIAKVGVNSAGEMSVPDGGTNYVGWYKYGTLPGNIGSAVLDAHVFAAFAKLKKLSIGSDLYVEDASGATLHFVVRGMKTYRLKEMDFEVAKRIFNDADGRYLNLITCAGALTADKSTYDHRLVIHAELVQ